jgi:hypothetical protein
MVTADYKVKTKKLGNLSLQWFGPNSGLIRLRGKIAHTGIEVEQNISFDAPAAQWLSSELDDLFGDDAARVESPVGKYWLVMRWQSTSAGSTAKICRSQAEANAQASRMAGRCPGSRFAVLEAVGTAMIPQQNVEVSKVE